jgi:uncharacterized protein (TIGR03435 family)
MRLDRTFNRDALWISFRSSAILVLSMSAVAVAYAQSIAGTWQGTVPVRLSARVVLRIADAGNGAPHGTISFMDRSTDALPLLSTIYKAPNLIAAIGEITFRGKLSADGKSIAGIWTEGNQSSPVTFVLATPETIWTYSGQSTMPTISATADPSFEVATIKPSAPDAKNWGYSLRARLFQARANTVADLIQFAYKVRRRQIDRGPSWIDEFRFDVTGEPDAPGLPSLDQHRLMLRKLLAERFGLRVHVVQEDFAVYALVVDKNPPEVKVSAPSVDNLLVSPRELRNGTTAVQFSHTTMPEFAEFLMGFIQDRQIVDETGLSGRFDFTEMIPANSMGGSDIDKGIAFLLGVKPLGFKLAPKKEPLKAIVIDNVDQPTAN